MSAEASSLPAGFEALEEYVGTWSIGTSAGRAVRREASNAAELRTFYDAATPRLKDALTYLDGKKLAEQDAEDRRLMTLMLSLAHVALAVEQQGDTEAKSAPGRRFVRITRATSDF